MLSKQLRLWLLPGTRRRRGEAGFTLVEILIAVSVISLGLVGVAAGFLYAVGGLEAGRQQTTAVFLAEQRMEQIKSRALNSDPLNPSVNYFLTVTTANFPNEAYGAISNNGNPQPNYRRTVTIVDAPGGLIDTKLVEVTVFYRPLVGFGVLAAERQVRLSALLTDRK